MTRSDAMLLLGLGAVVALGLVLARNRAQDSHVNGVVGVSSASLASLGPSAFDRIVSGADTPPGMINSFGGAGTWSKLPNGTPIFLPAKSSR